MAEVTAFRHNALPYPIYGAPFAIVYPFLDADGDLVTGASTPDALISKNGDTAAACTNESTEIATTSGVYYLLLTGTELTCDIATIIAKSATSGMKTTVSVLYPRKLVTVRTGTTQSGSSTTIQLDANASAVDDYYNGMVCIATIDTVVEARVIGDYVGSTKTATIEGPNWVTATPDADDTFIIKLPEGARISGADVLVYGGSAGTFSAGRPEVNTSHAAGTAWGSGAITAGSIASAAITNAKFAAGAIDAAAIADGAIDAATLAADTLTAAKVAADVGTEIANAVWALDATGQQTQGTFGQAVGDPAATAKSIWGVANALPDSGALTTLQADTDNIQTRLPAALESGRIAAALDATGVDAILDDPIEGSMTLRQAMRIVLAACANKLSGAATTTVTIRDLADTKARITATVDADGNRSAVTLDAT